MLNMILQVQMLLAALSALLPLVPSDARARVGEILDVTAKALSVGAAVGANLDDLAGKLAAVRAEVETMAATGRQVTAAELDAAMARVRTASTAFRAALETAEQGSPP